MYHVTLNHSEMQKSQAGYCKMYHVAVDHVPAHFILGWLLCDTM